MRSVRVVLAGAIGNVVEWYDFGLYGLLAPVLAGLFFPFEDRLAALLGAYGGFAVGFAMRPLGAVVLGRVGDRRGRKFVLVLSVILMGGATVGLGLLPTYAAIGIGAPLLLIAVRMFQGFSVGGEFVGSVTYLVETAPEERRGLAGSVANLGATIGMLLAAGAAALAEMKGGEMWRAPFLFGGVLAMAAFVLRRHLPEEPEDAERNEPRRRAETLRERWPAWRAVVESPKTMALALVFTCGYGISNYLTMVFLPGFAHEFAHLSESAALKANTAGQALALAVVPLAGWFSDRWMGRGWVLALAFFAQAGLAWALFGGVLRIGDPGLWTAQLALAGLLAVVMGTAPAMLSEQFPREYRVSAHALVLNVGIGVAGGTAPMLAVALIRGTGSAMAPAAYLAVACAAAGVAACLLKSGGGTG
ncbi:MAG TPA: MFS transporter [Acidobacteriaceae bacterium]|nr:MFS transporter [Acidobacteriaceae bacterium]